MTPAAPCPSRCGPRNTATAVMMLAVGATLTALPLPAVHGVCMTEPDSNGIATIPDTVTSIGDRAFFNCSALTHAIVSDTVVSIGIGAFSACANLNLIDVSDSVASIGDGAFSFCTSLISVIVPDSVASIGEGTFFSCPALVTATLSRSATTIPMLMFAGCSGLLALNISDSIETIETFAFVGCHSLANITIPDSVRAIGDGAFQDTDLGGVFLPENVSVSLTSFSGGYYCGYGQSYDGVIDYIHGVAVNEAVNQTTYFYYSVVARVNATVLRSFTFSQCILMSTLTLADTVQVIAPYAVAYSLGLDNVTIPDSVVSVGEGAFFGSRALRTVRIPPSVRVSQGAFASCGCDESLYVSGAALSNCARGYVDTATNAWIGYTTCDLTREFESQTGTYTSDYVCAPLRACSAGISSPHTPTTNRMCSPATLNTADKAGISVGVVAAAFVVALVIYRLHRSRRSTLVDLRLRERLLHDEHADKEALYAENIEMKRAWEIREGDLVLEHELASGGFGTVWKARWGHIDVAVKTLKVHLDDDVGGFASEDFNREVSFMQKIRHPNLLIFYGAGVTADRRAFMVVELMPHGSMRKMLLSDRPLTCESRVLMAVDIARGMSHLHSLDCIHRDLKSDNCLAGADFRVKVADLGTSRLLRVGGTGQGASASGGTRESVVSAVDAHALTGSVGTPLWMAPELMDASGGTYGMEVDVYSFGVIMWELVCRATPWEQEIVDTGIRFSEALRNAVLGGARPRLPPTTEFPEQFVDLMQRCWAGAPEQRPTFSAVVAELSELEQ